MTTQELKKELEDIPDDYIVSVKLYDHQFDTDIKYDISIIKDGSEVLIYGQ